MMKMPFLLKAFLGLPFMQSFLKGQIDKQPEGPTDEQRRKGEAILIGVARNGKGDTVRSRLRTPEGYTLTAATALAIAQRAANGDVKVGFQTPSLAYGADFVLGFDGVRREDLNA
jgi:short subunit dehydrogenase-like uncharacterized protein